MSINSTHIYSVPYMEHKITSIESAEIYELAPISLWVEDFSAVRKLLEGWREDGITDLGVFLREDLQRVKRSSALIRVLKVNLKTLSLFGADNLEHLIANLDLVFRDDMLETHIHELTQLWSGKTEFCSNAVNYTLDGQRLDIHLKGVILPGYEQSWQRILLSVEDVTERENARRQKNENKKYAEWLFEHSPVSLWVEDFSHIKHLIDNIRDRGITDFRTFIDVHPEFVTRCMSEIRVINVNLETLALFQASDKHTFLHNLGMVFKDDMHKHFREQLNDLWNGILFQRREVINYALDGSERHVLMQFSVLPGYEDNWSLVQVALTDITARKKAEAYLEYLGKHDVLTKLHNRAFFVDELNRLERKGFLIVSIIIIDLNRLKSTNDEFGHGTGDDLLRRIGEVLNEAITLPCHAARIGGDEFAVIMPGFHEGFSQTTVEDIMRLVKINNQFYSQLPLNISIGTATRQPGERLEDVVKRADLLMYEHKRQHYSETSIY